MKVITSDTQTAYHKAEYHAKQHLSTAIRIWISKQEPSWEYNRIGISATGMFIQVTAAAGMIAILVQVGASLWIAGIGVFLAFISNSIAFAQSPMRWVVGLFAISITVNILLALLYGIPLVVG